MVKIHYEYSKMANESNLPFLESVVYRCLLVDASGKYKIQSIEKRKRKKETMDHPHYY